MEDRVIKFPALFAAIAIANVPIYFLVARSFFDDWSELWLVLRNAFASPFERLVMFFNGQSREAQWPTAKLLVLLIVLTLLVISEYTFIADHFPQFGEWAARHL